MTTAESRQYQCDTCSKAFGRAEHLKRHELIHVDDKPFKCHFCRKAFIRRDALTRHESTHNASPSLLQRGGRACLACAAAKARCSGDVHCTRCAERSITCSYPDNTSSTPAHQFDPIPPPLPPAPPPAPPQDAEAAYLGPVPPSMNDPMHPQAQHSQPLISLDYWDPTNVLSSTNWLEVLDPNEFADYPPFHDLHAVGPHCQQPTQHPSQHPSQQQQQQPLPATTLQAAPNFHTRQVDPHSHPLSNSPGSVFSAQSNAVTESNTSTGTHTDSPSRPGEYYVDGEPARLPRVKRRRISTARRSVDPHEIGTFALRFANVLPSGHDEYVGLSDANYEEMRSLYHQLCIEPSAPWLPFEPLAMPHKPVLEYLVGLYFKHFDQMLPFIHRNLFGAELQSSSMVLAMASIGCQFLPEEASSVMLTTSMHEFVRRCLLFMRECSSAAYFRVETGAAELLHLVGSAYCGDARLLRSALDFRRRIADVFEYSREQANSLPKDSSAVDQNGRWISWARREGHLRLAYAAWLVDCILAYTFQIKPCLCLKDAQVELPCPDKLWQASTAYDWVSLHAQNVPQPTLVVAMQELFVDKRLPRERGEFARIIMIHGLYQRLWEVEQYLENPLSQWAPTASRQSSSELLPSTPVWLPSVSMFTKWQNSSCDALDILHWQANATIGQASGLEHPTVLHLHLARIILLAPYREMERLARSVINKTDDSPQANMDKHMILRWATQHQYKARLALIHAGVVFWHVRRYSVDAFYEAPAVGLAALVLWAFGSFTNRKAMSRSASQQPSGRAPTLHGNDTSQGVDETDHSDDAMCEIILIDRPTDDELVQQFIRNGHKMKAHLTAVGDLFATRGPERALMQGTKLLSSLRCWGVNFLWLQLLQGLVDATRKARDGG